MFTILYSQFAWQFSGWIKISIFKQWYKSSALLSQDLALSFTETPSTFLKKNEAPDFFKSQCPASLTIVRTILDACGNSPTMLYRVWVPAETKDNSLKNQFRFHGRRKDIFVVLSFYFRFPKNFQDKLYGVMIKSSLKKIHSRINVHYKGGKKLHANRIFYLELSTYTRKGSLTSR